MQGVGGGGGGGGGLGGVSHPPSLGCAVSIVPGIGASIERTKLILWLSSSDSDNFATG